MTFPASLRGRCESRRELLDFPLVPDERSELGPLLFDGAQLFEDVLAFNRFDAPAECLAARQTFAAPACLFERGGDLASALGHAHARSIGARVESPRCRRVRARQRVPGRTEARKIGCDTIGIRDVREALDGGTQRRFLLSPLFFGDATDIVRVFDRLQHRLRAPSHGFLLRACLDAPEERHVRARQFSLHHASERGQRNVPVLAVQRGGEQLVGRAQAGRSGERRALHFRVTGNVAERTVIRQSGEGDPAHAIGSRALRDHRHAPDVRQQAGGCRGFGIRRVEGQREQSIRRDIPHAPVGIRGGHAPQNDRVDDLRKGRCPDLGIGVVLRQCRELDGVTQLGDRLQSNDGVGVLPAGLRLESVENSHRRTRRLWLQ